MSTHPVNVYHPEQDNTPFAREKRKISLVPSVEVSRVNDRLWCTWYTGAICGENHANYCVLATSGDNGANWREVLFADPPNPRARAFDPELWIAPDGRLHWTWTERDVGPEADLANPWNGLAHVTDDKLMEVILSAEEEPGRPLPAPRQIGQGVMMCKPTVLSNGTWLYPVAAWKQAPSARFRMTVDGGKTFSDAEGITLPENEREFDEHQVIERPDGSLKCLIRAKLSGLYEADFSNGGASWAAPRPSALGHPNARLFIRKLQSGNYLLVKHGLIGEKTGRERLTAFLSPDGVEWAGGLILDARPGISYPDGTQKSDGTIVVAYDHDRQGAQEILLRSFTEADILDAVPAPHPIDDRPTIIFSKPNSGEESGVSVSLNSY